ncbi:MAG: hypothetical protein Q8Q50_12645 [Methylobacter sp.]|jgi:hypothetical protein|nr:hypothetical protein [Methylobacter sp.]
MKIYLALLLLFTLNSNAANNSTVNSYDATTGTLRLNAVVDLREAKKYTGIVAQMNEASVISEDSTPAKAHEVASYDSQLKVISIPSLTYLQDGSQHYHVQANISAFSGVVATLDNTYDASTGTLTLSVMTDLQAATTYTGVVARLANVSVDSEDSMLPAPDEVATYDSQSKIITIPSLTYLQDGSQHYHLKAVVDSLELGVDLN